MHASKVGRDLHLSVQGLDPFVIKPLNGRRGLELSNLWLDIALGIDVGLGAGAALFRAVDGVGPDGEWIERGPIATRMESELSLEEGYVAMHAALIWQTILGMPGVEKFIADGGGHDANLKAYRELTSRLAPSRLQILRDLGLANLTSTDGSSDTATPSGSETPDAQPDGS